MASRRMFSIRIVSSARFLKMPISSQALYFHLGLHADDDGVVEAYTVMNSVGCAEDDLKVLVSKGFVQILNEDLVSYITDWSENNLIRADRKIDSIYKDLLISINPDIKLIEKKERADRKKMDGHGTDNGQSMDGIGKDRLGKDSIGKDRIGEYQLIADMYNDTCVSFPKVTTLSDARKKAIKARLKTYTIDDFKKLFTMAEDSDFLKGKNDKDWSANFDWLIKDSNMAKVLDGQYRNRAKKNKQQETNDMIDKWIKGET